MFSSSIWSATDYRFSMTFCHSHFCCFRCCYRQRSSSHISQPRCSSISTSSIYPIKQLLQLSLNVSGWLCSPSSATLPTPSLFHLICVFFSCATPHLFCGFYWHLYGWVCQNRTSSISESSLSSETNGANKKGSLFKEKPTWLML